MGENDLRFGRLMSYRRGRLCLLGILAALVLAGCQTTGNPPPEAVVSAVTEAAPVPVPEVGPFAEERLSALRQRGIAAYNRGEHKEALSLLDDPMSAGDHEAQLYVGMIHWYGQVGAKHPDKAMHLFRLAAAQGNAPAMNIIGYSFDHGIGIRENVAEALKWYRRAAARGERRATNNLALLYFRGRGVPRDYTKAHRLWLKSAELNHSRAMVNLGIMYADGTGVAKDGKKAAHWWRRAIALGEDRAAAMLGLTLLHQSKSEKDFMEAARLLQWAASAGYGEAAFALSALYYDGKGVPRSEKKWIESLNHAVRLGHPVAAVILAGVFNRRNQSHKGFNLFRLAADKGYARGQALLGLSYQDGHGVAKNARTAAGWFRKAAKQGDAIAQYSLAHVLNAGIGVKQNRPEAARYYRLAAEQGHGAAAHNLSLMLLQGNGIPRDYVEGTKWATLAADQGEPTAINNVAFSLSRGLGVKQDIAAAVELYQRAANYGQPNAMQSLAAHLYQGKGTARDPAKAYYWIVLAERFYTGQPQSQKQVAMIKRQLYARLAVSGIDRTNIEKEAAAFVPKLLPVLLVPPAKPYSMPLVKSDVATLQDALPAPNEKPALIYDDQFKVRYDFDT